MEANLKRRDSNETNKLMLSDGSVQGFLPRPNSSSSKTDNDGRTAEESAKEKEDEFRVKGGRVLRKNRCSVEECE